MLFAVAPDGELEPFAERIDDADADAVEAARDLVGVVVAGVLELTPGVELGHDDFGSRYAFFGMNPGWNAPAVVLDRDRSVGVQLDEDPVAMPRQRFVDRIVADLEHHMVEAGAVVGVANVHAGAFAHRVEALEDLDAFGAIFILVGIGSHGVLDISQGKVDEVDGVTRFSGGADFLYEKGRPARREISSADHGR